jgi:hypothetical protein
VSAFFELGNSSSAAFGHPQALLFSLQTWTEATLAFLDLQLADSRLWVFSAFIIMWTSSQNTALLLYRRERKRERNKDTETDRQREAINHPI